MKELKTYIFEDFFSNVGANNIIKPVIDAIKDASINDKINSDSKRQKFRNLLLSILTDIETDIKKGKLVFEYIRNIGSENSKITISLEIDGSNDVRWAYITKHGDSVASNIACDLYYVASNIASDLYYELKYPSQNQELQHSIAKTIKVTEFKLS